MTADEIFKPYATVAVAAAKELKKIEKKIKSTKSLREKKILKRQFENIKSLINRAFRLTGDFMPIHISEMANKYCIDHKLGDISKITWSGQAKFEKKINRDTCNLKHEHKTPVGSLVQKVHSNPNVAVAIEIFKAQEIVWITKAEDKKLPRTNRPNSDKCYKDAGIKILKSKKIIGYLFDK